MIHTVRYVRYLVPGYRARRGGTVIYGYPGTGVQVQVKVPGVVGAASTKNDFLYSGQRLTPHLSPPSILYTVPYGIMIF